MCFFNLIDFHHKLEAGQVATRSESDAEVQMDKSGLCDDHTEASK